MGAWTIPQILGVLRKVGFGMAHRVPDEPHGLYPLEMACCICLAESGGNPTEVAWDDQPPNNSVGWFQLSDGRYPHHLLLNPEYNAVHAHAESGGGSSWAPWCTAFGHPPGDCGHRSPGDSYCRIVAPFTYNGRRYTGVPAYWSHVGDVTRAVRGHRIADPTGETPGKIVAPAAGLPAPSPQASVRGEDATRLMELSAHSAHRAATVLDGAGRRVRAVIRRWR